MARYEYLLWDIDGTILNFKAAEKAAIQALFPQYGFGECSDEAVSMYSEINKRYWHALELGEITKREVLIGRFEEFFALLRLDPRKAERFNDDYQSALGDTIVFCDDAKEILEQLKGKFQLIAVTNGTAAAQSKKLRVSGLEKIFDRVFISEAVGFEKPNRRFFETVFHECGITDRSRVLMIGDSLTSDIRGGINAGIDTCWYNPNMHPVVPGNEPVYMIRNLHELDGILK